MAVDNETLAALLDGELDAVARARVEQAIAADPTLRDRLEAQRRLRERLAAHYGPVAEERVPERLRELLEPKVVDLEAARARRSPPLWRSVAALAATLLLGLILGRAMPDGPVAIEDGAMLARGDLADALETQLASAQAAGAATRIGVSFAGADGRYCRTFERGALSGLACRGEEGWRLAMTAAGAAPSGGEYRQAGSGGAAVLAAAQEMMAGAPLDAEAERRARDAGWRIRRAAD